MSSARSGSKKSDEHPRASQAPRISDLNFSEETAKNSFVQTSGMTYSTRLLRTRSSVALSSHSRSTMKLRIVLFHHCWIIPARSLASAESRWS